MTVIETKDKTLNDAAKAKIAKKTKRWNTLHLVVDTICIYTAVVSGVLMTESALDIQRTKSIFVFDNWSWVRLITSALIAMAFMAKFEVGGDLSGKKKNAWRRMSHAFSQGAALRGAVEWFALLFTLSR